MGEILSREDIIPGVWDDDLDAHPEHYIEWVCGEGYTCSIRRDRRDWAYRGYVQLPPEHACYMLAYEDLEDKLTAPGGVTFGENGKFGFDCAHYCDIQPGEESRRHLHPELYPMDKISLWSEPKYWTFEEVKTAVESLAKQLKQLDE